MNANDNLSMPQPETLMEAVKYFADEDVALKFMISLRWSKEVCCPRCGSVRVRFIATRRVWECRETHLAGIPKRFSIKTGTIMEESPLPLSKWLVCIWLEANAKNSISSYEIHRSLGITQKSAWFMLHRIRLALKTGSFEKMTGEVESDESYIGGLTKNMHHRKRLESGVKGGGGTGKAIIHGLLERGDKKAKRPSKVKATVVPNVKLATLLPIVKSAVQDGSALFTDTAAAYTSHQFRDAYIHEMVDHAEKYVQGKCHTNGLENFWSLFKRCIKGTHVSVEPAHLLAYVDSEAFRFNHRTNNDGGRFLTALGQVEGKRLTYKALIGAVAEGEISSDSSVVN